MRCQGKISVIVSFSLALALLASCAMPAGQQEGGENADLRTRLIAANLLAGSLAEGLNGAIRLHAVAPGGQRALLIRETLDAVERSLDGAGTALRVGLPQMATRQITAAELQLDGLEPLLQSPAGTESAGDAP
jgi:hypothetical protein